MTLDKSHDDTFSDGELLDREKELMQSENMPQRLYRVLSLPLKGHFIGNFRRSRDMLLAIADAMEAHDKAYFSANILHRNISNRSILINSNGGGILYDWGDATKVHKGPVKSLHDGFICGGYFPVRPGQPPSLTRALAMRRDIKYAEPTAFLPRRLLIAKRTSLPFVRKEKDRYRVLSLPLVGRRLTTFKRSYDFVSAMADAMQAHDDAYFIGHILHSNVSLDTVLMSSQGCGLLFDWDSSIKISLDKSIGMETCLQKTEKPCTPVSLKDRSKSVSLETHQTIKPTLSHNRLRLTPHSIADDRESSLWVTAWTVMKYHECLRHSKGGTITHIDKFRSMLNKKDTSQETPLAITFQIMSEFTPANSPGLQALIRELQDVFRWRYLEIETEMLRIDNDTHRGQLNEFHQTRYNRLRDIERRHWLVQIFRKHLADESKWPTNKALSERQPWSPNKRKRTLSKCHTQRKK